MGNTDLHFQLDGSNDARKKKKLQQKSTRYNIEELTNSFSRLYKPAKAFLGLTISAHTYA